MKILFVGFSNSIHTVRWIEQLDDTKWSLYLYPSQRNVILNKGFKSISFCVPFYSIFHTLFKNKLNFIFNIYVKIFSYIYFKLDRFILYCYVVIIRPDIIHSLETQHAGYLVYSVKAKYFLNSKFPTWWHTNWGSDIYIYGRIKEHKKLIALVLENCNYYSCECNRDISLAINLGFKNHLLSVYPNTGGFKASNFNYVLASSRKSIMLKGYQGWAGRALTGLRALARCVELLNGYTIFIYSNTDASDIKIAANLFESDYNIPVVLIPVNTDHSEILKLHSISRISIGLSIGDAISTSLLEAMSVGSFPIQSNTACAEEWLKDGVTGFIVEPEDSDDIVQALRVALTNDFLVNKAAEINMSLIKKKLNYNELRKETIDQYNVVFSSTNSPKNKFHVKG